MIVTEIYNGQGLGNQLWCYVVTKTIALDKGYEYGIMNPHKFKCLDFMNLDFGLNVIGGSGVEGGPPTILPNGITNYYKEHYQERYNCCVNIEDNKLININDNTKIDGIMQSENYILHRKSEIKKWLKVNDDKDCYDYSDDNICVINFRGGEYIGLNYLFLTRDYWYNAIKNMLNINNNLNFIVITDDVINAKRVFPQFSVYHFNIGKDYSIIKNSKYAIISNSSFAWFPLWTSDTIKYVIAPKYWARHNVSDGYWSCGYNITRNWLWMDSLGKLFTYDECVDEFEKYKKINKIYENI